METTERKFMFRRFKKNEPDALDDLIDAILLDMKLNGPDSSEYPSNLAYLERLTKLKEGKTRKPVSGDTIVFVVGNIIGVVFIAAYEQKHVMSLKAFGSVLRPSIQPNRE